MKIINGKNVYIQKRDYNLLFETPEEVGYYIDCTKDLDFVLVILDIFSIVLRS